MIRNVRVFSAIIVVTVIGIAGFNSLIIQQENILRRYFILEPEERMRKNNTSLAESLSKYFIRENRASNLDQVKDYIRRYGGTSLFELVFLYKDSDGALQQVTKSGVETATSQILTSETVYPVSIENGRVEGYLAVIIKETGRTELKKGLAKYQTLSYSLRLLYLFLLAALVAIALYHGYSAKMKLARDIAEVKASNDGLTGLHTHEYFLKVLQIEVEKFRIYGTSVALLMLDIDHFKTFNDTHGHQAGDRVLQEVSKIIKANTRATDVLARYGGEEFAVIIPYVARIDEVPDQKKRLRVFISEVRNVAERIRHTMEETEVAYLAHRLRVTISIGGAFYYKRNPGASSEVLLKKADAALYKAKRFGRNRVCIDYESAKG